MNLIHGAAWSFAINDPSFIAWLIVVAYFVAAVLCWRAQSGGQATTNSITRVLWSFLSLALVLLGLNKQLDLHPWIIGVVRNLIAGQEDSQAIRGIIIVGVGVFGVAMLALGIKSFLATNRQLRWAYGALCGLLGAQVLRFLPGPISGLMTAHVFTEEEGLLHVHTIELLELASLTVIALLAHSMRRKSEVPPEQSPVVEESS